MSYKEKYKNHPVCKDCLQTVRFFPCVFCIEHEKNLDRYRNDLKSREIQKLKEDGAYKNEFTKEIEK